MRLQESRRDYFGVSLASVLGGSFLSLLYFKHRLEIFIPNPLDFFRDANSFVHAKKTY